MVVRERFAVSAAGPFVVAGDLIARVAGVVAEAVLVGPLAPQSWCGDEAMALGDYVGLLSTGGRTRHPS